MKQERKWRKFHPREAAYALATYTTAPGHQSAASASTLEFDPPCSLFCRSDAVAIELGSGTGYAGVYVAQQLGLFYQHASYSASAAVVLTDLTNVVPLLDKGLGEHQDSVVGVEVRAQALAWGDADHTDALAKWLSNTGRSITHILCSDLVSYV